MEGWLDKKLSRRATDMVTTTGPARGLAPGPDIGQDLGWAMATTKHD